MSDPTRSKVRVEELHADSQLNADWLAEVLPSDHRLSGLQASSLILVQWNTQRFDLERTLALETMLVLVLSCLDGLVGILTTKNRRINTPSFTCFYVLP